MKHSLTRMQRILWTASMHAILRSKLSLLSSVLFSIPLPRKFSIPCSLDIVFKVGVKWLILLVKHEKQGFFRAVDAVVVSQVRDCLHPRRVYLSEEIFLLKNSNIPLSSQSCTHWRALLWSIGEPGRVSGFHKHDEKYTKIGKVLLFFNSHLAVVSLWKRFSEVSVGHIPCHSASHGSWQEKINLLSNQLLLDNLNFLAPKPTALRERNPILTCCCCSSHIESFDGSWNWNL